jgi:hypothetical protein
VAGTTLENAGRIDPGTSPGLLTLTGSIRQAPTGTVDVEIGGLGAGSDFDQLRISGAAALDGTLNLSLVGGFVPNIGESFDVVTFVSRMGVFGT